MSVLPEIIALKNEMTAWRHHLHANAELSGHEQNTALFLEKELASFGLTPIRLGENGVVATLRGKTNTSGKAIILRADTDALPILEDTQLPYTSKNEGVMHACGHDGHMAMLLGAAKYLAKNPDFDGTVHFLFQPAEEIGRGADEMIKAGLFEKFPADAIYGLHNTPIMPLGMMGTRKGDMLGASNGFKVTLESPPAAIADDPVIGPTFSIVLSGKGAHVSDAKKVTDLLDVAAVLCQKVSKYATITDIKTASIADNVLSDRIYVRGFCAPDKEREVIDSFYRSTSDQCDASINFSPENYVERNTPLPAALKIIRHIKDHFEEFVAPNDKGILIVTSVQVGKSGTVEMMGTFRSFSGDSQQQLKSFLEETVSEISSTESVLSKVEYDTRFPALYNTTPESDLAVKAARQVVGLLRVIPQVPKNLGTEDFSYYLEEKPGNFMALGTGPLSCLYTRKGLHGLHSAKYDFNDAALPIGASYWIKLTQTALTPATPVKTPNLPWGG